MRLLVTELAHQAKHICNTSGQFQMKLSEKLFDVVRILQNTQTLVISRCYFAEDGQEMYKDL